ncbi:MAG: putative sulfate exporter family transporter [Bdellovibrionales bacterium]|nr:putative sulfate exporter family transporter [Bdellovibrionales bacterium]
MTNFPSRAPGWALLFIIAWVSQILSSLIEVGEKHPVEAALIAILLGITLRNLFSIPIKFDPGISAFEKLLVFGIVLIGASLNFSLFASQGTLILLVITITMLAGLAGTLLLSKLAQLPVNLGVLLSVGTTICGGTAIAVIAPLLNAKEEETSYAIGTIALWGLAALLLYPATAAWLGVSDQAFGIFAGTAIHSTPQVVGAGHMFSELAGTTATAVKLIRNCFLAPAALLILLWHQRSHHTKSNTRADIKKAFPWFLFGYFVMAWLNTQGVFPQDLQTMLVSTGKFFILSGMVGVGLNTRLNVFRQVGWLPAGVGLVATLFVALVSAASIYFLGLG